MAKKKMPQRVAQAVIDRADGRCEVMNFPEGTYVRRFVTDWEEQA